MSRSHNHYCRMLLTRHYNQRPFDETACDALIVHCDVKKPSKKMQKNIYDGGYIKHGSDFSCVCDAGHTVNPYELSVMRQNNRNAQPHQGVCDIWRTVHSDKMFVMRQNNRDGQPDEGVCDIRHTIHSHELFALSQENKNGST